MIKVFNCNNKNYLKKLQIFLDKRRFGKKTDHKIVSKIIKDVKKNKLKAVLKYEKKFTKNNEIKIDFAFKNPISPYEVFESPDSRKLGILIKSVKITPI